MTNVWDMLNAMVTVPQWYLAAIGVVSIIASFVAFLLADYLNYKRVILKVSRQKTEPDPAIVPGEAKPIAVSTEPYKPVPPIRQHYWYYVSGVSDRFATLREALSASGMKVPADKMLDWKKLTSDTRDRIKRVKVGDKQPMIDKPSLPEPVVVHTEVKKDANVKRDTEVKSESEQVIRKPIGNGAFVTFKKKAK